jgi:O-antigen/teichoic acid export membrane protein
MAVTLYTSRVILNVLGASDYGIYNVVGGVVSMLYFINAALSSGSSRYLTYELGTGNKKRLNATFSASLNLHIAIAFAVFILLETIGLWFFYEKLIIPTNRMNAAMWVYQMSIITAMFAFTQVPYNASLIAHENMSVYAYVGLYEATSNLLIVYLLQISSIDKLMLYALLLMLNKVAILIFYRSYTIKKYDECRFRLVKDKDLYKQLINYSGWDLIGNIACVIQGQGVNILLNMFFGPIVNAARAIAVQVQTGISVFVNNFLLAIRPQVVKSFAVGDYDRMFKLTFTAAKLSYMIMLAMVLPISLNIDFILSMWLGDNVPNYTSIFTILILLTYLMETFHISSLMSYHAIGKIKLGNIIGGTLMMLALPIGYIFLKYGYQPYSVFIVIFILNFLQMFWGWYIIHKYQQFSYKDLLKKVYIPSILVTIMISIWTYCVELCEFKNEWHHFIISTCSIEVALLPTVYCFGLDKIEKKIIKNYLKRKLNEKVTK